jgi:hypothetical protein
VRKQMGRCCQRINEEGKEETKKKEQIGNRKGKQKIDMIMK